MLYCITMPLQTILVNHRVVLTGVDPLFPKDKSSATWE